MKSADPTPKTAREAELTPSSLKFPVVGIGASAGGLEALLRFFAQMPSDNGMAFVVILHLSPEHESNADKLLQAATKMPVLQVTETMRIEANRVYVIAPTHELSMNDGYLRVAPLTRPRGRHVAIDAFFRSLAVVHGERALGVVLSGTGSDGAVGITRVKEQGGVTLAQAPDDASFDGMPRAAIATGMIDWVLPAVELPQKLVELWANARLIQMPLSGNEGLQVESPPTEEATRQAEDALRQVMVLLRARTGHDFKHYKRATVLRRLERRLQVNALPHLPAYRSYLEGEPREAHALLKDLLIGVTNFFRDRPAFEALEREVVPELYTQTGEGGEPVRAWVAGCATGEEAYSVAMLLAERAAETPAGPHIQVFGTDIDEHAITVARAAAYPESIVADVPPTRLRRWFSKEGGRYRIRKDLRERMLFAPHNLLRDPPFSRIDLICCRNLLIYIDRAVHAQILETFHFALKPGGYLFLGSSETADAAPHLFTVVDKKHRIYRATAVNRVARPLPRLPVGTVAATHAAPAPTQPERRRPSYSEMHRALAEQYAPPSVLLDEDANIVHLSAQAGRFLHHVAGEPSHHLPTLVRPELRLELRTTLYQAQQSGKSTEARRVQLEMDGRTAYVNIIVRPVPPGDGHRALALVLFDEVEVAMSPSEGGSRERDPVLLQLEDELQRTKEQLQATIEQSEASNEELKASNEELQAINEELRSTTEELETSKEELQSINEELITVNNELKSKVEETDRVNDDLQNIVAATDVATVFIDRALVIKRYTPRAADVFSFIATDIGRPLPDIAHRLDYAGLAEDAAEVFGTLRTIEREVASHDGRWYLARVVPYRTHGDRIEGAVLSFLDITERRRAEARSRLHEALMRTVAESTRDYAIITFDTGGHITSWNPGAERLFDYTSEQAIGLHSAVLFTPEDRAIGAPQEEMRKAREEGRAEDDRWHLRRDGTRVYMSGITTPLRIEGEPLGYFKIARDLTGERRKQTERDIALTREIASRAEAQAASELKDEFLAVMSHELKNPLNLVLLNAELIQRLPESQGAPGVQRAAAIISRTVRGQAKIIDDLLDLSRINTGKLALQRSIVDWAPIVLTIVEAMAEDARHKEMRVAVDLPEGPVLVHADAVRLEQIVWNLVNNALKFTPRGGSVTVRLALEDTRAVLEVRDSGRGIAASALERVFGLFQQADVRSREQGGLGIGLAVVKHVAELHDGGIAAASDGEGQGATFTVWLPVGRDAAAAHGDAGAAGAALPAGLRALVVDDDAQSLDTLRQVLALEGLEVTVAHGGREALEAVRRERYDAVLCDIAMPGMDGYQFIEALRALPGGHAMPVIAVTGFGRDADARRSMAAGFAAHLSKPISVERLVRTLVEVLQR